VPLDVTTALTFKKPMEFKDKSKIMNQFFSLLPEINYGSLWGYLNGASQGHPPNCGVGVVLFIRKNYYIFIRYVLDLGSNNRVGYIALWTLLETAKEKNVRKLQVMGDSKCVIMEKI